jgi:hypothetical protein
MTTTQTVVIAVAVVVGFALHASIRIYPDTPAGARPAGSSERHELQLAEMAHAAQVQSQALQVQPAALQTRSETLISAPTFSQNDKKVKVDFRFYRYSEGTLVRVPVKDE